MTTLDKDNPTAEQLAAFNAEYMASLSPVRLSLYDKSLSPSDRIALAYKLAATGEKIDLLIEGLGQGAALEMINRVRSGYLVFGYIGEGIADWEMTRPGDVEPGRTPYNSTGHTGIVSLTAPPPFAGPVMPPAKPFSFVGIPCGLTVGEFGMTIGDPDAQVYNANPKKDGTFPNLPEGTPYTDPLGRGVFLFHMAGRALMDARHRQIFWLGPQPS